MALRDILTNQQRSEIDLIKQAAVEIWHAPQHRHYTDHKPESHSERIIEKLDRLVENLALPFSSVEAFVLLAAAYLHDIGMQNSNTEWKTLDEIREHHHLISRDMIIGSVTNPPTSRALNLRPEYAEEVALVAAAHRRLDLALDEFNERPKGGVILRLRLLSALLRLADALDMDYRRVIMENLSHESVDQTSRLHWWRCHYVEAVDIRDGLITARLALPSEDYTYYLKASIEDEVRAEVHKLQQFLWPQVKLSVAESPKPRIAPTKMPMLKEDFEMLRRQVLQQREQESANAISQIAGLRKMDKRPVSRRIVLVDDTRFPGIYHKEWLELAGYDVKFYESVDDVEPMLHEPEQVDLFILDIMMPSKSPYPNEKTDNGLLTGLFLARDIREVYPNAPIILFSNASFERARPLGERLTEQLENCILLRKSETDADALVDIVNTYFK